MKLPTWFVVLLAVLFLVGWAVCGSAVARKYGSQGVTITACDFSPKPLCHRHRSE